MFSSRIAKAHTFLTIFKDFQPFLTFFNLNHKGLAMGVAAQPQLVRIRCGWLSAKRRQSTGRDPAQQREEGVTVVVVQVFPPTPFIRCVSTYSNYPPAVLET